MKFAITKLILPSAPLLQSIDVYFQSTNLLSLLIKICHQGVNVMAILITKLLEI